MTRKSKVLFIFTCLIFSASAFGLNRSVSSDPEPGGQNTQQVTSGDKSKAEMSDAEKLASWNGEKVTILATTPFWCPSKVSDGFPLFYHYEDKIRAKAVSVSMYAGQTGVIIESKQVSARRAEIVVQMDKTGEKIVGSDDMGLGFHSELETAKAWVGHSLWSKGTQTIAPSLNGYVCQKGFGADARLGIRNLEKVTITRVEFGTHLQKIYILARTDDGREGWLDGWSGNDYVDGRFHFTEGRQVRVGSYSDRFYLEDPRKLHPDWEETIWKSIESGEVTVGMSQEMARAACGRQMKTSGSVLAGDKTSAVYECGIQKFVVEKGKVTRHVERPEIKAALATLIVDEVQLSSGWPPGCQPPFCTQAKSGEHFLCVYLREKEKNKAGNLRKETGKVYVLTPEGTKAQRWAFSFEVDQEGQTRTILAFKVRTIGGDFTLFWPDGQSYKLTAGPTKEEKR